MTKYFIVIYENITDECVQIPRSCERAALPLTIINTNYLHLEQEVQQLPVHSTSFPPVAVIVLFILCFFLYAFCSHVGPSRHLKCLSRREAFHHNTSKDMPFLFFFHFHTRVGSHVSGGEKFNPHLLIRGLISIPETLDPSLSRMHSCFSALRWLESLSLCR